MAHQAYQLQMDEFEMDNRASAMSLFENRFYSQNHANQPSKKVDFRRRNFDIDVDDSSSGSSYDMDF